MIERVDALARRLAERELDSLLVTDLVNIRYLTGFSGTNAAAVIGPDERLFFTDFRYTERAAAEVSGLDRLAAGRELLADVAKRLRGRVGFDDQHLSVRLHRRVTELAEGAELVPAAGMVEELRAVKDARETAAIRTAAEIANSVYEMLASSRLAGRTETELAWFIERELREGGAEDVSFPPIVAAADNGALPHASPRPVEIPRNTLVVLDLGCVVDGYCSDCTRTFATGALDDEILEVYDVVRGAQADALDALAAGVGVRDVDAVARDAITAAGYGDKFGHGLGHGVGLEVHEAPRLAESADGQLVAGNVVTVEPGVYLPGRFGVRIEDLVVVAEQGPEILTQFTKELVAAG